MQNDEQFIYKTGHGSDVGCLREHNEDAYLSRPDIGLWAVADGMGGHAAGDFASQAIVDDLDTVGVPVSIDDARVRFMDRLTRANDTILRHAAELDRGSIGATLVALLVQNDDFACIWCGDSRLYLLRDGMLCQQSRDHTEVQALLDAGAITERDAATWPRKNVITRAIGVTAQPDCDIVAGQVKPGDVYVLCSDGLTEHLADDEIAVFAGSLDPQEACNAMIRETLARGARDNVTVIAVQCLAASTSADASEQAGDEMDEQA